MKDVIEPANIALAGAGRGSTAPHEAATEGERTSATVLLRARNAAHDGRLPACEIEVEWSWHSPMPELPNL